MSLTGTDLKIDDTKIDDTKIVVKKVKKADTKDTKNYSELYSQYIHETLIYVDIWY